MTPLTTAAGALAGAVVAGAAASALDLGRPVQVLEPPYVEEVPTDLLVAFAGLGGTGLLVSAVLARRLTPTLVRDARVGLVALLAVTGTAAAACNGLYYAAIENAIPLFAPVFVAVPVVLSVLVGRWAGEHRLTELGVLVATPIAAVTALGWGRYEDGGPGGALGSTLVFGGIGLAIGLIPAFSGTGD